MMSHNGSPLKLHRVTCIYRGLTQNPELSWESAR